MWGCLDVGMSHVEERPRLPIKCSFKAKKKKTNDLPADTRLVPCLVGFNNLFST